MFFVTFASLFRNIWSPCFRQGRNRFTYNKPLYCCMKLRLLPALLFLFHFHEAIHAQTTSLNGEWKVLIDPAGVGDWRQVWLEDKPQKKTDFFEYSFNGAPVLKVPGDFNSQKCELTYYEGTVWYQKQFNYNLQHGKRLFLHFDAVNYVADVYLNGSKLGSHEGGFTPFQFEITGKVKAGANALVVKVNNSRHK